ncbi:hypothetical protein, partial [Alloscardovia omnicolens]
RANNVHVRLKAGFVVDSNVNSVASLNTQCSRPQVVENWAYRVREQCEYGVRHSLRPLGCS